MDIEGKYLHGDHADAYTLYLKTHNYHWNVTGPMFTTLHAMLEQQYQELVLPWTKSLPIWSQIACRHMKNSLDAEKLVAMSRAFS